MSREVYINGAHRRGRTIFLQSGICSAFRFDVAEMNTRVVASD
jgi:hypothetical protein